MMLLRRRHLLHKIYRHPIFRLLLVILFISDTLHVLHISSRQIEAASRAVSPPRSQKRVYIASQHWNDGVLLRSRWNNALVELVQVLGVGNVFVSIYESGSYDNGTTKAALGELDAALGDINVKRRISLSDVTHAEEIEKQPSGHGWVKTPQGKVELRRIPFLARLRNQVLEPLESLTSQGENFDLVLFLNDVVFTTEDVLRLLDTNNGDYAAVCSLDFQKPPAFYDTFALRDSNGHEAMMLTWPYFRSRTSRRAVEDSLPVPVSSCWNGMVAMPAEPFLAKVPLRFRGISDTLAEFHLEGSECCLIHADNPLSAAKGVFLNPNVKVGYNATAYDIIHSAQSSLTPWRIFIALWKSRVLRWATSPVLKEWVVQGRLKIWSGDRKNQEPGDYCLVNEMQVIRSNGWKHV